MKHHWLNRNSSTTLLALFAGWSMDERAFSHLKAGDLDVLVLYDYADPKMPVAQEALRDYRQIYVAGWSMGVWAAAKSRHLFPDSCVTIAINGTLCPIHDRFGIAPAIYDLTLAGLTEEAYPKFCKRMFTSNAEFDAFRRPARTLENQRLELISLKAQVLNEPAPAVAFSHVLISEQDKIIPARNQLAYWGDHPSKKLLPTGHYPFFRWTTFEELISEAQRD